MTDANYHNSNQLPKYWMEMYSRNYDVVVGKELDYSPICTEEEIRKMVGIRHVRKQLRG